MKSDFEDSSSPASFPIMVFADMQLVDVLRQVGVQPIIVASIDSL